MRRRTLEETRAHAAVHLETQGKFFQVLSLLLSQVLFFKSEFWVIQICVVTLTIELLKVLIAVDGSQL